MIALYAEERQHPGDDTLVFLKDKLSEDHKVMTIIGEKPDIKYITDTIPSDLIYKEYVRPIDASAFIKDVEEVMIPISFPPSKTLLKGAVSAYSRSFAVLSSTKG